ncbi:hypothetical protein L6452_11952 [Arctium lappa]|uniref:Uncharacterized protein n=1 Tax=Arctium lappa TaxID=4217 RepID=A0ACB9DQY3_ARCLA|nr:hypothetical protein L6452_11952 [Arctium lappa]
MDDLEVMPMSTITSITMLNKFHVKEIDDLEEKVVSLGMKEYSETDGESATSLREKYESKKSNLDGSETARQLFGRRIVIEHSNLKYLKLWMEAGVETEHWEAHICGGDGVL